MNISDRRLAANRNNAKKSTGPKTVQGKMISSQNSFRDGLFARSLAFKSPDDEAAFARLRENVRQALRADDEVVAWVGDDLAVQLLRLSIVQRLLGEELERREHRSASFKASLDSLFDREVLSSNGTITELQQCCNAGELEGLTISLIATLDNETSEKNASHSAAARTYAQAEPPMEGTSQSATETAEQEGKNRTSEIRATWRDGLPTLERYEHSIRRNIERDLNFVRRWRRLTKCTMLTNK